MREKEVAMHNLRYVNVILIGILIISFFIVVSCQKEAEPPAPEEPVIAVDHAVSADGVPIYYEAKGKGSPALVFIHGWSCDRSYWEVQVEHFRQNHKVVAVDLAGHGESGLERTNWTSAAFANDVIAVIEKLGLDQVILVGHSMGGMVMIEAARLRPDRIIGLVGADTLKNLEQEVTREMFDEFTAPFKENFPKAVDEFVRTMFPETADPELVDKIAADISSAPPEVGISAFDGMFDYWMNEMKVAANEIQVPVICINSDLEENNLEGNKKYLATYELMLMPGVGHFVMNEDPEKFNQLLEEAIEKILP
jgi:pimeloyl-ACP methyl ester carboxylesterase